MLIYNEITTHRILNKAIIIIIKKYQLENNAHIEPCL